MSGGIKYRLSPRERTLIAESLGAWDAVRARTKNMGVDLRLQDEELEVSVEENGGETSYELTLPLDNDGVPKNGRIYLKDVFRLHRRDGKFLAFERKASQEPRVNEKIRFWVELARRDHPREKFTSHPAHLRKFLQDLSAIPAAKSDSQDWKSLVGETLPGLHRPFPTGSQALVEANFEVFVPVRDSLREFGFKLKFGDPQSGLTLRRDGNRIYLGIQLVLDNDAEKGLEAERNGRIYLNDLYEIDAATGKVLSAARDFTPSLVKSREFDQVIQALRDLPPLSADLPELKNLCTAWIRDLGAAEPEVDAQKPIEEPQELHDKLGQALWRLYRLTGENPLPGEQPLPLPLPTEPELRRNLHRALGLILTDDRAALETEAKAWPPHPALNCLLLLARQDIEGATRLLEAFEPNDELGASLRELLRLQSRARRLDEGFPLLESALQERIQRTIQEDRAWSRGLSRAWEGESSVNPEMRQVAVGGFLRRLRTGIEERGLGFTKGIDAIEGDGPFEKEVRSLLKNDATLRELTRILDESDAELRRESLVHLARGKMQAPKGLPATALSIAERYSAIDPKAEELRQWLSGQAGFGQKFESVLGHFSQEVANPFTLGTMMLAGGASKVGKLAFVKYFGNGGLGLKIGAEALSVGLEATVFVGADKIYQSAFHSPVGVWERAPQDWAGALLAFGVLRGGGITGRRLQSSLRDSEAWQAWLQGRTRLAWAEKPLERARALSEASGKGAVWKKLTGRALAWPLRYASETGLPRAWLKPTANFAAQHGLILASLMAANSLSRFMGLRPGSPQGWKADLVDDALMYGHFYVAGQLLHRLGPSRLDFHLAALESSVVPGLRQSSKPPQVTPGETPVRKPAFEIPPPLRDFGHQITSRLRNTWEAWRARSLEKAEESGPRKYPRLEFLGNWLRAWSRGLAGLRLPRRSIPPSIKTTESPAAHLMLPPASNAAKTLPPPPPSPTPTEGFLLPTPLRIPFRFQPTDAKVHMAVSMTGRAEDREVLPVRRNTLTYESVLGREELSERPEAIGVDFGFSNRFTAVEVQHARIRYQVKLKLTTFHDELNNRLTLGVPDKTTATLENMAKTASTYVNGKTVRSTTLKDGDRIQLGKDGPTLIFHQESPESTPTFTRAVIPLPADQNIWTLGRETLKQGIPDIAFPTSSRDISARQGRILRDEAGNYYLQDQGRNPTLVNGEAVYGTRPLQDGDLIRFGEQNEFLFRGPKQISTEAPRSLSPHPRSRSPEPAQAERHPMFRGMSEAQIQEYFQRLGESDSLPLDLVRAASLTPPQGRPLILMTQYTGWSVGASADRPSSYRLQFREASQTKENPFLIYLDGRGEFILKPLNSEAPVYVQGRKVHFWSQEGAVPDPQGPRQKVEGWTRLRGGERIHAGDRFYFDFWKFNPPPVETALPNFRSESLDTLAGPRKVAETASPLPSRLLLPSKIISLEVRSRLWLRSEAQLEKLEMRPQEDGMAVLIPDSLAKIAPTRIFREGEIWKIHSEASGETPISVNGIPLPANIALPLAPNSELSVEGLRFKVDLP